MCLCVCARACVCIQVSGEARGVIRPLYLELKAFVRHIKCMPHELETCGKTGSTLNCRDISVGPISCFKYAH